MFPIVSPDRGGTEASAAGARADHVMEVNGRGRKENQMMNYQSAGHDKGRE
jgi:hypothetical protein